MNRRYKIIAAAGLWLIWIILLTYLSHQPGSATYQTSSRLADLVYRMAPWVDWKLIHLLLRKSAHVILFGGLAVLTCGVIRAVEAGGSPMKFTWFYAVPFFWCWFDEFTKPLVQGRHNDWEDVLLNLVGCAIGIAVCLPRGYKLRV